MHNKPARLCIWGNSRKVVCAKTEQDAEGETDGIVGKTRKRRGRGWRAGLRRGSVRVREVQPGTEEGKEEREEGEGKNKEGGGAEEESVGSGFGGVFGERRGRIGLLFAFGASARGSVTGARSWNWVPVWPRKRRVEGGKHGFGAGRFRARDGFGRWKQSINEESEELEGGVQCVWRSGGMG